MSSLSNPGFFGKAMNEYITYHAGMMAASFGIASAYTPLESVFTESEMPQVYKCVDDAVEKAMPNACRQYQILKD